MGYTNKDFEKMPVSIFFEDFEIAILIGNYLRGGELKMVTQDEVAKRISNKVKKFKDLGLL